MSYFVGTVSQTVVIQKERAPSLDYKKDKKKEDVSLL